MQVAGEDEIRFGASRTLTVSSVEFAAPATRSSPHERNMRQNRGPVRHVAICGRANDGSSHKRPRFIPCRVDPFRCTSARYGANDRVTDRRMHGYLFGTIRRHLWEMTSAAQGERFDRHSFTIAHRHHAMRSH